MIQSNIPGFPGLVLGTSMKEHGSMPKATSASPKKLANRDELASFLGFDAAKIYQAKLVHGADICFVTGVSNKILEADALITDSPGHLLTMATADCYSVFLLAPSRQAVSIIHAGWRGTVREYIVPKALELFRGKYSLAPGAVSVFLGPGIRKCCFEVKNDENGLPNFVLWPSFISGTNGQHFIDLAGIIKEQLYRAGIRNISDCGECTCCSPQQYFSFRREKNSLRNLAFIGFR